jgi:hypothetical protein
MEHKEIKTNSIDQIEQLNAKINCDCNGDCGEGCNCNGNCGDSCNCNCRNEK